MPFPWTLQRYILREMSKTFALSAIALTGVLGLGGGVMNMIKLGEVTPAQLFQLMALVLPLAAALTLPVAALFSATSTYGRLSADNEFVACRSSGIDLYVLLVPTLVLSVFAAGVSFAVTNFVIPGMVRNLNEFIDADIGALVRQRLSKPKGIVLGGTHRIHADECLTDPALPNQVALQGIAFVELDRNDPDKGWVRFGTARSINLAFDRSEAKLSVSGVMTGLSYYDRKLDNFFEEAEQIIPPNELPAGIPREIKFLQLHELLHYLAHPTEWDDVRRSMQRLRFATGRNTLLRELYEQWGANQNTIVLSDGREHFTLHTDQAALSDRGDALELFDLTVTHRRLAQTIHADRAVIDLARADSISESGIRIDLYQATILKGTSSLPRAKYTLGPIKIGTEKLAQLGDVSDEALLAPRADERDSAVARRRDEAVEERSDTSRRIVGVVNERMAFSVSIFVLVILGAVLAIVFRGSHVMTAFGISFVPSVVIIVGIVTGKQVSHNADTHALGIVLLWSGIVLVGGLDAWILARVLRR